MFGMGTSWVLGFYRSGGQNSKRSIIGLSAQVVVYANIGFLLASVSVMAGRDCAEELILVGCSQRLASKWWAIVANAKIWHFHYPHLLVSTLLAPYLLQYDEIIGVWELIDIECSRWCGSCQNVIFRWSRFLVFNKLLKAKPKWWM